MKKITGEQLRKARHISGMTQEESSQLLGINRSYVSQIETGKNNPSLALQRKIHFFFGEIIDQFTLITINEEKD